LFTMFSVLIKWF